MDNVTQLRPADNPDTVLEKAKGELESVLIIGYDKEGCLDVRASLNIDHSDILWMIERFKQKLICGDYSEDS